MSGLGFQTSIKFLSSLQLFVAQISGMVYLQRIPMVFFSESLQIVGTAKAVTIRNLPLPVPSPGKKMRIIVSTLNKKLFNFILIFLIYF